MKKGVQEPIRMLEHPSDENRISGNDALVYVHGISRHQGDYSRDLFAALKPWVPRAIVVREVLWSPHVNPRALKDAPDSPEPGFAIDAEALKSSIEKELQERLEHQAGAVAAPAGSDDLKAAAIQGAVRGTGFSLDDFARYMLRASTRTAILNAFREVAEPLLSSDKRVHVISHSWGSVVAYEGLREIDADEYSGRIANLFTLGSALSLGTVQANLSRRLSDGRCPAHVDRWINLDAAFDIVGGTLRPVFQVSREFLAIEPVGCHHILPTRMWRCAHSSYFHPDNVHVNRDILARHILM